MSDAYWEAFFAEDSGDFVSSRSEMTGILKYNHSLFAVWGSH